MKKHIAALCVGVGHKRIIKISNICAPVQIYMHWCEILTISFNALQYHYSFALYHSKYIVQI